jgi:hypothetical protein
MPARPRVAVRIVGALTLGVLALSVFFAILSGVIMRQSGAPMRELPAIEEHGGNPLDPQPSTAVASADAPAGTACTTSH